jgi:WhiB family redox-sensing transcriptional regulator
VDDWREKAACLDEDPDLFFPIGNTGPALLQIEQAKAVCRRCDVRATCLRWALDSGTEFGVWGGQDEDERRGIKRRARVKANRETARERLYAAPDGQPDDGEVPAALSA